MSKNRTRIDLPRSYTSPPSRTPVFGVNIGEHLHHPIQPPTPLNGCSRTTPILNQRFGPYFNRRFTQPSGAPYPLRPQSVSQGYEIMDTPQLEPDGVGGVHDVGSPEKQSVTQKYPATHRTQSAPPTKAPRIVATVPYEPPQRSQSSHRPPTHLNLWAERNRREEEEERLKHEALLEFKNQFPVNTPVRDILTAGYFKEKERLLVPGSKSQASRHPVTYKGGPLSSMPPSIFGEPSTLNLPSTSGNTSSSEEPSTSSQPTTSGQESSSEPPLAETDLKKEVQGNPMVAPPVPNYADRYAPYMRKPPIKHREVHQPVPYATTDGSVPRNAQNQLMLPVKIQQQLPSQLSPNPSQQSHTVHAPGQGNVPLPPFVLDQRHQPHQPQSFIGPQPKPLSKYMERKLAKQKQQQLKVQEELQMQLQAEQEKLNRPTAQEVPLVQPTPSEEQPQQLNVHEQQRLMQEHLTHLQRQQLRNTQNVQEAANQLIAHPPNMPPKVLHDEQQIRLQQQQHQRHIHQMIQQYLQQNPHHANLPPELMMQHQMQMLQYKLQQEQASLKTVPHPVGQMLLNQPQPSIKMNLTEPEKQMLLQQHLYQLRLQQLVQELKLNSRNQQQPLGPLPQSVLEQLQLQQQHALAIQQAGLNLTGPLPPDLLLRLQQQQQQHVLQTQQKAQQLVTLQQNQQETPSEQSPQQLHQHQQQQQQLLARERLEQLQLEEKKRQDFMKEQRLQQEHAQMQKLKQARQNKPPKSLPPFAVQQDPRLIQHQQQQLPSDFHLMSAGKQEEFIKLHKLGHVVQQFLQHQKLQHEHQMQHQVDTRGPLPLSQLVDQLNKLPTEMHSMAKQAVITVFKEDTTSAAPCRPFSLEMPVPHHVVAARNSNMTYGHPNGEPSRREDFSTHVHERMDDSTSTPIEEQRSFSPTTPTESPKPFDSIAFTIDSVANPSFNPEAPLEPRPRHKHPVRVTFVDERDFGMEECAPRMEECALRMEERAPRMEELALRIEKSAPRMQKSAPGIKEQDPRMEERSNEGKPSDAFMGHSSFQNLMSHCMADLEAQQNCFSPAHVFGALTEVCAGAPPSSKASQVKPPKTPKNKPGRPRKIRADDEESSLQPAAKKTKHSEKQKDSNSVTDSTPKDKDTVTAQEHQTILLNLPVELRVALVTQKENDRKQEEQEKKKPKRKYTKKVKQPLVKSEPLEGDLQDTDIVNPLELLKTVNDALSGKEQKPVEKKRRGRPRTVKETKLTKKQQAELERQQEEMNRNPPIATAVATSGAPLTLNIYDNPPTLIEAPIWTDDSGPLVPHAMYRTDLKTSRRSTAVQRHNQKSGESPRIVTKAALKIIPPSHKNKGPVLGDFYDLHCRLDNFPTVPQSEWTSAKDGLRRAAPRLERKLEDIPTVNNTSLAQEKALFVPVWAERLVRKQLNDKDFMSTLETVLQDVRLVASTLYESQQYSSCEGIYDQQTQIEMQEKSVMGINRSYDEWVLDWAHANGLDFDRHLMTVGSRWPTRHELMVAVAVVRSKHMIVDQKLRQLDKYTALTHNRLRRVANQDFRSQLESVCFDIQDLCSWLNNTADLELKAVVEPKSMFQLADAEFMFKLKWEAIKKRMSAQSAARIQYTNEDLRNAITSWERATYTYMITFDETKRVQANEEMRTAHAHLVRTFQIFDAMVDVYKFSSRIHILCNHLNELYRVAEETEDRSSTLRRIKKTEFLLMIAETKSLLVQSSEHSSPESIRRIDICNAFIEGDSMNVEKRKLKRLMMDKEDENAIAMCEKILEAKAKKFYRSLGRIGQSELQKRMPTKPWIAVIRDELEAEQKQEQSESHVESPTNSLAETVFNDPIETSSLEELIIDFMDLDKISFKREVRELCNNFPETAKKLQWRHAYCQKKLCHAVDLRHKENLRGNDSIGQHDGDDLSEIGALFKKHERVVDDVDHSSEQLSEQLKKKKMDFRKRKHEEANRRYQYVENLNFRPSALREPDTIKRLRSNQQMQVDLNALIETCKNGTPNPFVKDYDYLLKGPLPEIPEKESDEECNRILIEIKEVSARLRVASEQELVPLQKRFDNLKKQFRMLKKKNSDERLEKLKKFTALEDVSTPALSEDFYATIDNLEKYDGLEIDLLVEENSPVVAAAYHKLGERVAQPMQAMNQQTDRSQLA